MTLLEDGDVHVWRVDLDTLMRDMDQLRICLATLDAYEITRRERLISQELQDRFALVRGILRRLLSQYLDRPADRIEIIYNDHGRPGLKRHPDSDDLQFNLTHSANMALIAIARDMPIGIDLEHIQPSTEMDSIVSRWFSSIELAAWQQLLPEERLQGFYNGWTRKEAFIKAIGRGLAYPLKHFSVTLKPGLPPRILEIEGRTDHGWSLHDVSPNDSFAAALAAHGTPGRLHHHRWIGYDPIERIRRKGN